MRNLFALLCSTLILISLTACGGGGGGGGGGGSAIGADVALSESYDPFFLGDTSPIDDDFAVVLGFDMTVDGTALISSMTFDTFGSIDESTDVTSASLYLDTDGSGTLSKQLLAPSTDTQLGDNESIFFDDGTLVFNFVPVENFGSGTYTIFLVFDLAGSAALGETLGAQLTGLDAVSNGGVDVDPGFSGTIATGTGGAGTGVPLTGALLVTEGPQNLAIPQEGAQRGTDYVPSFQVNLEADGEAVNLTQFTVYSDAGGLAIIPSVELSNAQLWHDVNSDGAIDAMVDDQLAATAILGADVLIFSGAPLIQIADGTDIDLLVQVTFNNTPSAGDLLQLELRSEDDIAATGNATSDPIKADVDAAITGGVAEITGTITMAPGAANPADTGMAAGTADVVMCQALLSADAVEDHTIDTILVTAKADDGATNTSANDATQVSNVKLWTDPNGDGSAADGALLGSTSFSGDNGTATFSLGTPINLAASASLNLLVTETSNAATPFNKFFAATFDTVSSVGDTSGQTSFITGSAFSGGRFYTSAGTGTLSFANNAFAAAPDISANGVNVKMLDVTATALAIDAHILSVVVAHTGSGNPATQLSGAAVAHDMDDNGIYDSSVDTILSTDATLGASSITIDNIDLWVAVGTPARLLVLYTLNGNAAGGDTFQAEIVDPADITIGATSSVAPFGIPLLGPMQTVGSFDVVIYQVDVDGFTSDPYPANENSGAVTMFGTEYDEDIGTTDGDGIASYLWEITNLADFAGAQPSLVTPTAAMCDLNLPDLTASYDIEMSYTVTGDDFSVDVMTFTINVTANNDAPTAVIDVPGGTTVVETVDVDLDGTMSTDPENETLTYAWSIMGSPPAGVVFEDSGTTSSSSPAPTLLTVDDTADYNVTVQLTVTDPGAANDADSTVITVKHFTATLSFQNDDQYIQEGTGITLTNNVVLTTNVALPTPEDITVQITKMANSTTASGEADADVTSVTFLAGSTSGDMEPIIVDPDIADGNLEGVEVSDFELTSATGHGAAISSTNYNYRAMIFDSAADGDNDANAYYFDTAADAICAIEHNVEEVRRTAWGASGFGNVAGLAYDSGNDILYGVNSATSEIITINPNNGAGAALGVIRFDAGVNDYENYQALAFGSDGSNDVLFLSRIEAGTNDSFLVKYRPSTRVASVIGGIEDGGVPVDNIRGLAMGADGLTLYGVSTTTELLYIIDTATAEATPIIDLASSNLSLENLAEGPTNTLYTVDTGTNRLYAINTTNGVVTQEDTGINGSIQGLTYVSTDMLIASNVTTDVAVRINVGTADVTLGGFSFPAGQLPDGSTFDLTDIEGMTYDTSGADVFWVVNYNGAEYDLYSLDPETFIPTMIGTVNNTYVDIRGLAWDSDNSVLYGIDANVKELFSIDTANPNNTATLWVLGLNAFSCLAYDPSDFRLYFVDDSNNDVWYYDIDGGNEATDGALPGTSGDYGAMEFRDESGTDIFYTVDNVTNQLIRFDKTDPSGATATSTFGFQNVRGAGRKPGQ